MTFYRRMMLFLLTNDDAYRPLPKFEPLVAFFTGKKPDAVSMKSTSFSMHEIHHYGLFLD